MNLRFSKDNEMRSEQTTYVFVRRQVPILEAAPRLCLHKLYRSVRDLEGL